jgi:hypothetical protein
MDKIKEKKNANNTKPIIAKRRLFPTSPLPVAASVNKIIPKTMRPYSMDTKYVSRTN